MKGRRGQKGRKETPRAEGKLYAGVDCRLRKIGRQTIVSAEGTATEWDHPWSIETVWEKGVDGEYEWHAYVTPGFLNGRDVYVPMPKAWPDGEEDDQEEQEEEVEEDGEEKGTTRDVALTDEPAPYLALVDWRNPLEVGGINAAATYEVDRPVYLPGEGYFEFFKSLNVRDPAKGGFTDDREAPDGTREIRALEVVLSKARVATSLDVQALSPVDQAASVSVSPTYNVEELARSGGRAQLRVTQKFVGDADLSVSAGLGLALQAGDTGEDQTHIATIWMVSQPDAGTDGDPDETWEAYVQYRAWWNLAHATKNIPALTGAEPLQLTTGLVGGLGDVIGNVLLSPLNDAYLALAAYYSQAETRGLWWTV